MQRHPSRGRPGLRGLATVLVAGFAGATLVLSLVGPPSGASPASLGALAAKALQPGDAEAHDPAVDLADVAERATASVVNISSTKTLRSRGGRGAGEGQDQGQDGEGGSPFENDPFFRKFFQLPPGQGIPQERRAQSLGSGVIVDDDGIVLTNNHVVDGADEIKVTLADNREFDAKLVGADPESDVAVIRIEGKPSGLHAVPIGDSSTLRLADTVLAIGNPFGVGQTVTMGIVSATGRANVGIADYEDFIQTDAAINPGNSGGALLNVRGELVGINTAIVSRSGGYQGIGFAIPSNMARSIMTSLLETGKVERGWLGVSIQPLDRDLADAMGIDQAHGVLVADVSADSPAAKAGIERGDVILSIDGHEVKSTGELRNLVASRGAGKSVSVAIVRDKEHREVKVELGALPEKLSAAGRHARIPTEGLFAGVAVADLDDEVRGKLHVDDKVDSGAVVTGIERDSAAARAGLRPGDVVVQLDRKPVKDAADFRALAAKADDKSSLLLVARKGGTIFVLVRK